MPHVTCYLLMIQGVRLCFQNSMIDWSQEMSSTLAKKVLGTTIDSMIILRCLSSYSSELLPTVYHTDILKLQPQETSATLRNALVTDGWWRTSKWKAPSNCSYSGAWVWQPSSPGNYAPDKLCCEEAWAAWKGWLEASKRNQPWSAWIESGQPSSLIVA